MKTINKNWHTIKIIMINWLIFTLLLSTFTAYYFYAQAMQCKIDWERLGKKIENGEVTVKTEQKVIFDKQGMEKK